jgi:hypothetical protein
MRIGKTSNVIAACLGASGAALLTVLLLRGNIAGPTFLIALIGILFVSYVLHRGESVSEVDFKNLKVTLRQIEQAKTDIYAKVDTVRRLGEQIAELGAWNVRTVNRMVGEGHQRQMLSARDQIATMLRDLGSEEARISAIVAPINTAVANDLKHRITDAIFAEIKQRAGQQVNAASVHEETQSVLKQYDRGRLTEILRNRNLYTSDIERRMDDYEAFIRDGRLST